VFVIHVMAEKKSADELSAGPPCNGHGFWPLHGLIHFHTGRSSRSAAECRMLVPSMAKQRVIPKNQLNKWPKTVGGTRGWTELTEPHCSYLARGTSSFATKLHSHPIEPMTFSLPCFDADQSRCIASMHAPSIQKKCCVIHQELTIALKLSLSFKFLLK